MWRADVGPNGYNLVQQGANSLPSAWCAAGRHAAQRRQPVVVYSTGACTTPC